MNTLPNFFIVGAARSGTTSLDLYLSQHPELFITPNKETHFFAREQLPKRFTGPGDDSLNKLLIRDEDQYAQLFSKAGGAKARGIDKRWGNRRRARWHCAGDTTPSERAQPGLLGGPAAEVGRVGVALGGQWWTQPGSRVGRDAAIAPAKSRGLCGTGSRRGRLGPKNPNEGWVLRGRVRPWWTATPRFSRADGYRAF